MHLNPYTVMLSDDNMAAWIRFHTDTCVPLHELQSALATAGICHGIDAFLLEDLAAAHQPEVLYSIATGSPAGEGIEYAFSIPTSRRPKRLPSGRIDFYNLYTVQHVARNQVVARKVPPAERRPGTTVCGRLISPSNQDTPLPQPGAHVRLADDSQSLIALIQGYPVLQDGVLRIERTYVVEGDICFSTGNIDCQGEVVVTGDINDGFSLHAGQGATVHGVVHGGTIRAKGNIHLYGNVFGKQQSTIASDASVHGIYLNEATVKTRQNIRLINGARHCDLYAGGSVLITGDEGHIIGGTVRAHNCVVTHHIGSEQAIPTDIVILTGIYDTTTCLDYLSDIKAVLEEDHEILTQGNAAEFSQMQDATLPTLLQNRLAAVESLSSYFHLQRPFLPLRSLQNNMLVVTGTIYPGVRVKIGQHVISIREQQAGVMFYEKNDQINIQPLD